MPDPARDAKFLEMRSSARSIFQAALAEASIAKAFARQVHCERGIVRVCEDLYDLAAYRVCSWYRWARRGTPWWKLWPRRWARFFEGIVASSVEPAAQIRGFRYFQGGHPTPNAESIRAASAMLRDLQAQTASSLVIFLISGGGSSIVEKPIDDEITLDDLIATYRALVHSSAPIAEINAIRKHLSAVKGGRLAQAAYPAQQVSLLVSDVPDNTPDALASGPTMPDSTSTEDCYRIAGRVRIARSTFPESNGELFERHALEETPKSDDPAFCHSRWWTVLSNQAAIERASLRREANGLRGASG